MNKNIDLTKILKYCPEGTKLYSTVFGDVEFVRVYQNDSVDFIIEIKLSDNSIDSVTTDGRLYEEFNGECILFPSKDQRDWSKFTAPWYKKERFDPNTLKPFDAVLVIDSDRAWTPLLFSYLEYSLNYPRMQCLDFTPRKVIPYNQETKHLLGTHNEAPEYYRYWED